MDTRCHLYCSSFASASSGSSAFGDIVGKPVCWLVPAPATEDVAAAAAAVVVGDAVAAAEELVVVVAVVVVAVDVVVVDEGGVVVVVAEASRSDLDAGYPWT